MSNDPDGATSLVFDAGHTYGPAGKLAASDALFVWDFGDGTGATGQVVRHTYAEAGRYDATLTVVTPDGATATATGEVAMLGADMLAFDPRTGMFETEKYGETTVIENSDRGSVATETGTGSISAARARAVSVDKSRSRGFSGPRASTCR